MKRIAIIGGGFAGVTAAYELARLAREGAAVEAVLFEASGRLGGTVQTSREGGYVIEGGPDGWVTEKPWAQRLAEELGLSEEILPSNDTNRRTYVLVGGSDGVAGTLQAMPEGMRMMVPGDLAAMDPSEFFSAETKKAFHDELGRAEELPPMLLLEANRAEFAPEPQPEPLLVDRSSAPRKRRSLPDHLPREVHTHLPREESCSECGGALKKLGEDISEMLEYLPASFKVIRHVRPRMCRAGCDRIVQAPAPSRPIDRGLAGPGLLAHVLTAKFCDYVGLRVML